MLMSLPKSTTKKSRRGRKCTQRCGLNATPNGKTNASKGTVKRLSTESITVAVASTTTAKVAAGTETRRKRLLESNSGTVLPSSPHQSQKSRPKQQLQKTKKSPTDRSPTTKCTRCLRQLKERRQSAPRTMREASSASQSQLPRFRARESKFTTVTTNALRTRQAINKTIKKMQLMEVLSRTPGVAEVAVITKGATTMEESVVSAALKQLRLKKKRNRVGQRKKTM